MDNVDLGRALKAPFQEGWIPKSLLAIVWTFLIVTTPALMGAYLEYVRSVAYGDERLPEWSGFGEKWVKGIAVIGASTDSFFSHQAWFADRDLFPKEMGIHHTRAMFQ